MFNPKARKPPALIAVCSLALFAATCPFPRRTTVLIQMTGLMLITPPGEEGGRTYVMMPDSPGLPKPHSAWIGFGGRKTSLCVDHRGGICYVDLDQWSVEPIGRGGWPRTARVSNLHPSLLNLSDASGGHTVDFRTQKDSLRAHITFLSGRAGEACSLGDWEVEPVNRRGAPQPKETILMANVLNWVIRQRQDSLTMV